MLDERKTKEETEIADERRRLQNERIKIAEDFRRYEASSRLEGAYTPIPDDDSAYSSSREPSGGTVSKNILPTIIHFTVCKATFELLNKAILITSMTFDLRFTNKSIN